jgi:hypothetical protein
MTALLHGTTTADPATISRMVLPTAVNGDFLGPSRSQKYVSLPLKRQFVAWEDGSRMSAAIEITHSDHPRAELRALAARSEDADKTRRLLASPALSDDAILTKPTVRYITATVD